MTDERLFERLAAHAGPADIDPGFEDRLYMLLQQEMGRSRRSSRPILLLVAALLAILAISAAVAVGSGLIEVPRLDDDRSDGVFPLAGPTARCDQTIPDDVLLIVRGFGLGEDWPDATELTVHDDGLVVVGPSAEWGGSTNTLEASWSQRRLTEDGAASLIDAVTNSLPNCQSFELDANLHIRARANDDVYSIRIGPDVLETRTTSQTQAAAVSGLVAQLDDPELGLPASDWIEDQWHAYVPERWRFLLYWSVPSVGGYPSSDGIVLPDGSTLRAFGSEIAGDPAYAMARCAIANAEEAEAIAAILTDAGGRQDEIAASSWGFADSEGTIWITAVGLLPFEPDCPREDPAAATPAPVPGPSALPDQPAPFADACDYLPDAVIREVIGSLDGETEHYPEWSADWAFCWQPVAGDGLVIFASRRSFPGERAVDQAGSLFGDASFNADQIAGRDAFFNSCEADEPCRAAVAISAEPHLVVITWQAGSQATLRQLAERLIQELETAD